ncbi:hypothetical protein [Adhaeribacter pallidiroseus]|uniref:Uncharacterized protein n=1 Tax=Adhaeribacter pallidiroseus TaxID=2072847 RepID=A0A369QG98_9BACT|nr:hypothetical protein [Adhaeribacter pallidiroseus]RDC61919.1 hypothetical protein AHMF7616_00508 [Adhaeribacter pallidiroseus]
MQLLRLTFKTLFGGRIKYITYISIVFFISSLIVALITVCLVSSEINKAFWNVISNILLGIGTSILAAALISTFELINVNRVINLIKFFSIDVTKKTVIVLPHFYNQLLQEKERGNYGLKTDTLNEITFVSYADFTTVKYLIALFQEHNLGLPEIMTDDEALEILSNEEKLKKYNTFLSLGLYSNKFSNQLNSEKIQNRYFNFEAKNVQNYGDRKIEYLEPVGVEKENWLTLTPNNQDCSDLSLISKINYEVNAKQKLNILILGGLNATGTKLLGEYIYNQWDKILCKGIGRNKFYELRPIINEKNFCMIFKINGQKNVSYDENATIKLDSSFCRI